jgi:hypothetical protein
MEQVWNLPGPARPGYVQRLGRAVLFLALLGAGVIVTTGLSSLIPTCTAGSGQDLARGGDRGLQRGHVHRRLPRADPEGRADPQAAPGAITGGILWTVLQFLGTYLVHHYLHSDSVVRRIRRPCSA